MLQRTALLDSYCKGIGRLARRRNVAVLAITDVRVLERAVQLINRILLSRTLPSIAQEPGTKKHAAPASRKVRCET